MTRHRTDRRLDEARPDLIPELLAPFDPHQLSEHSDEVVLWQAPLGHAWRAGHVWEATVAYRAKTCWVIASTCAGCSAGNG
jgi:hypothetical protein